MKQFLVFLSVTVLFFTGCSSDPVSPLDNIPEYGNILFKIDRENAPENVQTVIAYLTRADQDTISASMNLLSDTTADLSLNNILAGTWHLVVNALDQQGQIVYSGETDVTIIPSTTIQVTLTLLPTGQGTGNIYIYVTWGTAPSGWSDFSGNPVLAPYQCPGNPLAAKECRVIYDEGKYKMWYMGVFNSAVAYVYYAESVDGKSWTHPQQSPVLLPSYNSWDNKGVGAGAIIKEANGYRMFYSGWNYDDFEQIGMAVSEDGKNWTKSPLPIIHPPQGYTKVGVSSAVKVNNKYYVYFGISNYSNEINVAISTDLVNWEIHAGILPATHPWELSNPRYASVIYENNQFKMVYQNANYTAFGEAFSTNGYEWEKNPANPIIRLNQVHNNWCYKIAYPNVVKFNNIYRIYYSGETSYVAESLAFFEKL